MKFFYRQMALFPALSANNAWFYFCQEDKSDIHFFAILWGMYLMQDFDRFAFSVVPLGDPDFFHLLSSWKRIKLSFFAVVSPILLFNLYVITL